MQEDAPEHASLRGLSGTAMLQEHQRAGALSSTALTLPFSQSKGLRPFWSHVHCISSPVLRCSVWQPGVALGARPLP